jgi:hypothetical protein
MDTLNQKGKQFTQHFHLFILNEEKKEIRKRMLDKKTEGGGK